MKTIETIKICDGVNIETDNGVVFCESPRDIWELFKWDIDNNPEHKKGADIIMHELLCFGVFDISVACGFKKCVLRVVPCKG